MNITALVPDEGDSPALPSLPSLPQLNTPDKNTGTAGVGGLVDFGGLVASFTQTGTALDKARQAEQNFVAGKGNLLEMALDRATADALLNITAASASKLTQATNTLMNIQL